MRSTPSTTWLAFLCFSFFVHSLPLATADEIGFSADTSHPEISTFNVGEPVILDFMINTSPASPALAVHVRIVDEFDRMILERDLPFQFENGVGKATLDAPHDRLGFYRVFAKLSDGRELPALGSRPQGYLTYCVMPDPSLRPLYPEDQTYFGMQGAFCETTGQMLPYLGVRWFGDGGYRWSETEPDHPGQFEEKVQAAEAQGKNFPPSIDKLFATYQKPVVDGKELDWKIYSYAENVLSWIPKWAAKDLSDTPEKLQRALSPDAETNAFDEVTEVGTLFARRHPGEPQHIYEITWEPVAPSNYIGTDDDLVRAYRIAYTALHKADPKAIVMGPCGWTIKQTDWYERLFKAGIGRYLDAVSVHAYGAYPPERNGFIRHIRALKEIIRRYTGKDLPLYSTEEGNSAAGSPEAELAQALGLIRQNLILLGEGFKFSVAFYNQDYIEAGKAAYGYYFTLTPKVTWGAKKLGPKPIAPAFAAMTNLLEGHVSAGPIDWLGGTAYGYVYERIESGKDDLVLALWDYGDAPREVSIPVGVPQVTVNDWMGNAQPTPSPGGMLTVKLGPAPTYVQGVSPKLWGENAIQPITLKVSRITGCPGDTIRIEGSVKSPDGKAFQGNLTLSADSQLRFAGTSQAVIVPEGGEATFAFSETLASDMTPGSYAINLLLGSGAQIVGGAGATIEVMPTVSIDAVRPLFAHGAPKGIEIDLSDARGTGESGTLRARLKNAPETDAQQPFSLAPHGKASVRIEYDAPAVSPFHIYNASVSLAVAGGGQIEETAPINFFAAPRLETPPAMDGTLRGWEGIPSYELSGMEWVIRSPQFYAGASARLRYAWNDDALYMAWEVKDSHFVQEHNDSMIWKGDSLQLAFNLDPGVKEENTGNGIADTANGIRDCEITVALTPKGPMAIRDDNGTVKDRLPEGPISSDKLKLAAVKTADGLVYEIAIPWKSLGADRAPKAGEMIGIAAAVNDMNDPAQADPSALGIFALKHPDQFGILTLTEAPGKD